MKITPESLRAVTKKLTSENKKMAKRRIAKEDSDEDQDTSSAVDALKELEDLSLDDDEVLGTDDETTDDGKETPKTDLFKDIKKFALDDDTVLGDDEDEKSEDDEEDSDDGDDESDDEVATQTEPIDLSDDEESDDSEAEVPDDEELEGDEDADDEPADDDEVDVELFDDEESEDGDDAEVETEPEEDEPEADDEEPVNGDDESDDDSEVEEPSDDTEDNDEEEEPVDDTEDGDVEVTDELKTVTFKTSDDALIDLLNDDFAEVTISGGKDEETFRQDSFGNIEVSDDTESEDDDEVKVVSFQTSDQALVDAIDDDFTGVTISVDDEDDGETFKKDSFADVEISNAEEETPSEVETSDDADMVDESLLGDALASIGKGIGGLLSMCGKGLLVLIAGLGGSFLFGLPGLLVAVMIAFGLIGGEKSAAGVHEGRKVKVNEGILSGMKDKIKAAIKMIKTANADPEEFQDEFGDIAKQYSTKEMPITNAKELSDACKKNQEVAAAVASKIKKEFNPSGQSALAKDDPKGQQAEKVAEEGDCCECEITEDDCCECEVTEDGDGDLFDLVVSQHTAFRNAIGLGVAFKKFVGNDANVTDDNGFDSAGTKDGLWITVNDVDVSGDKVSGKAKVGDGDPQVFDVVIGNLKKVLSDAKAVEGLEYHMEKVIDAIIKCTGVIKEGDDGVEVTEDDGLDLNTISAEDLDKIDKMDPKARDKFLSMDGETQNKLLGKANESVNVSGARGIQRFVRESRTYSRSRSLREASRKFGQMIKESPVRARAIAHKLERRFSKGAVTERRFCVAFTKAVLG